MCAQLAFKLSAQSSLYAGLSLDKADEDGIGAGGRESNQALFLVGRKLVYDKFQVALEYLNWKTEYAGGAEGTDNRLDLHLTHKL